MTIDPNDMGRISLINSEAMQHTLGRIEEALRGLREDLHEMMTSQKAFDHRMDETSQRVEILERWKADTLRGQATRAKLIAATVALIFLPAISWITTASQKTYEIMQHVEQYNHGARRP